MREIIHSGCGLVCYNRKWNNARKWSKSFICLVRLVTDATINEAIYLNRAELCESVVFLHSPSILTMLMNYSQTAEESPTKVISFAGEVGHRRNHKWSYCSKSRRIVRKCNFLTQAKYSNDSQTADELATKIISFVGEAGHRRNHKGSFCS